MHATMRSHRLQSDTTHQPHRASMQLTKLNSKMLASTIQLQSTPTHHHQNHHTHVTAHQQQDKQPPPHPTSQAKRSTHQARHHLWLFQNPTVYQRHNTPTRHQPASTPTPQPHTPQGAPVLQHGSTTNQSLIQRAMTTTTRPRPCNADLFDDSTHAP